LAGLNGKQPIDPGQKHLTDHKSHLACLLVHSVYSIDRLSLGMGRRSWLVLITINRVNLDVLVFHQSKK
jgi:hypothetical protein